MMPIPRFSEIDRYCREAPVTPTITTIFDLIGRHGKIAEVLRRHVELLASTRPVRVLDIGAWDRALGQSLAKTGLAHSYFSLDIDDTVVHDFRTVNEVTGMFDIIAMFEVIEHLSYEQADEMLHNIFDLLAPGARLFISTPNPFHPQRYFSDVSHRQHWPPGDLYALLRHVGFANTQIEMYGVVYLPICRFSRSLLTRARHLVWRAIGLDRRGGILAIAIKEGSYASNGL